MYTQFDRTMVMLLSDNTNSGLYDQSLKMAKIINPFISSLSIAILPRIANLYYSNNSLEIKRLLNKSLSFTIITGLFLYGMVILISPQFVLLFFGESFPSIIIMVQLASILIVLIPIGGVFSNQIALPLNRTRAFVLPTIIGALLNILLGVLLIPKNGAIGAIYSIIMTEFVVCSIRIYMVKDFISIKKHLIEHIYFITIYIILVFVGSILNGILIFSTIVNTIILITMYIFMYFIFIIFNKNHRNKLFNFISRR